MNALSRQATAVAFLRGVFAVSILSPRRISMKNGVRITLLVTGLALVIGLASVYAVRKEPWLSAKAAFQKGDQDIRKGSYWKAFRYVKMAADKEPGNPDFSWAATKMAVAVGNANAAYFYAQKAWKAGRKERDVLHALVQFSFFSDKQQKLNYALSLVNEMGDNIDKDDLRAELYVGFGETEKARRIWEAEFDKSPIPATAVKLARTYLQSGNDSLAMSFLQSCRKNGRLNDEGYGILARLFTKRGDVKDAERCYQDGVEANGSSDRLQYDHTLFLISTKNFDQATSSLDSMIGKYPDNKNLETMRIAVFLAKGDPSGAVRECDKSTAPVGAVAPLRARALIRLNRLAEAEAAYDTALAHGAAMRVSLEYGNFLLYVVRKPEKARRIFQSVHSVQPSEPVADLGLATLALEAKDVAGARKYVEAALSGKQRIPLAYQLLAQICLLEGNPKAALDNCSKALAEAPGLDKAVYLRGQAYAGLGQLDKADEVFTGLLRKAGADKEKSEWVKRALVPVKVRQRKFNEALTMVDELERVDTAIDIKRMRLEIYAFSHDIAKANRVLASLKPSIPGNDYAYYESWLLELGGDNEKAAAVLEQDLSTKSSIMRWAGLRLKMGKPDNVIDKLPEDSLKASDWEVLAAMAEKSKCYAVAVQCYSHALKHDENNAALLNNFAYASLQTPGFNREEVLKAIQKAYLSLSGRVEVLETYVEALNKCGKPAECIKFLQDKPAQTKQSVNLLYQLGTAYESTGDVRGALSSFRLALQFPETSPDWPEGISHNDLQVKVEKLKAGLGQ
jgi:predicted Zn-dependent protease